MGKKGVIFDLDGTLWEVSDTTYKSVNEITNKHNLKEVSINTVNSVFGLNREDAAKVYFPYLNLSEAVTLLDEISNVNINNLKKYGGNIYNNLENTLIKLKNNYDLYIVSNTGHKEYIEAFLTSSGLGKYFKDYVAASELNISKADAIRKVINEYNLEKFVYVGDTQKDKEATINANVPFIYAKYGFGKNLNSDYSINSISELPEVVEKILG